MRSFALPAELRKDEYAMIKNVRIKVFLIVCACLVWSAAVAASGIITGKVLDTMNSGGYTYVQLDISGQKVWIAIPETKEKIVKGKTMNFKPGMEMQNFESKSLKRTFDTIVFSEGIASGKDAQPKAPAPTGSLQSPTLSGKVLETMDSGGYTYVRIDGGGKKIWIAVPAVKKKIVKGQVLQFGPGGEMKDFESKTLKRKFDSIIFSDGIIEGGPAKKGKKTSSGKVAPGKVTDATSHTISELYADKKKLNHKNVIVKGKIIKASQSIMERNWYHLQDGSSDPEKGTLDLMVTSQDNASVGDEVVVTGMFFEEKDFGAGYKFEGIVENATIEKSSQTKTATPKGAETPKANTSHPAAQEKKKTE